MFNVVIFEDSFPDNDRPNIIDFDLSTCKSVSHDSILSWLLHSNTNIAEIPNKLGQLEDGDELFIYNDKVTEANIDLSNLKQGNCMFSECYALSKVNANLRNLVDGYQMFCMSSLQQFNGDLSNLISGYDMFTSWDYDNDYSIFSIFNTTNLDNLNDGSYMFGYSLLSEFTYDLKSLRLADSMFVSNSTLNKFCGDTSKLVEAPFMFESCTQLSEFIGDLSSLAIGNFMFTGCKLNARSVMYIVETIRDLTEELNQYTSGEKEYISLIESPKKFSQGFFSDDMNDYAYAMYNIISSRDNNFDAVNLDMVSVQWSVGHLTLGIDVAEDELNGKSHDQQLLEFANEVGYSTWEDLNQAFVDKGWQVEWQFNGPVQSAYRMTRNNKTLPVYAKLIEIQPEGQEEGKEEKVYTKQQKRYAKYCTQDGSKYYHISWGHKVHNTEDYTMYDSFEDVLTNNGLIHKEELQQS